MSADRFVRRLGRHHEYGHLRPYGKRRSSRIVRRLERALIAEFPPLLTEYEKLFGEAEPELVWCGACEERFRPYHGSVAFRRNLCRPCLSAWSAVLVA